MMKRFLIALALMLIPAAALAHMIPPVPYLHEGHVVQAMLLRGGTTTAAINPYPWANPCPQVSQNWCVETDGWTTFTPAPGTGTCGASPTAAITVTCVTYIAENGTGTAATCRIKPSVSWSFTDTIPDNQACPYTPANQALARQSSSDFLVYKRADCFVDPGVPSPCTGSASTGTSFGVCTSSGRGCNFDRNGASRAAPLVVGAYGPLSSPRPAFTTINAATMNVQGGNGDNLVVLDLEFNGGYLFSDYTNSTYNPGLITATATAAAGQNQIVMPSPPPSNLINNTNALDWAIYNFSNPVAMQNQTSCNSSVGRLSSISGSTLTLTGNIPAGRDIAIGDILVYMPLTCGNGGLSYGSNIISFAYAEGMLIKGAAIGFNPQTQPQLTELYLRRNVIQDSASVGTRNQGVFIGNTHNASSLAVVEENVADHIGWRQYDDDCTPGQFLPAKCNGVASTQFYNFQGNPQDQSQGVYDHEDWGNGNFLRNIFTNAGGSSIQVRAGGALYNNFLSQSSTLGTGGAIMVPNVGTYNVFVNNTSAWQAIATVTGSCGANCLTFAHWPQSATSSATTAGGQQNNNICYPFNASNPSGISQTTNNSFTSTPTSITIAGPAITASIGDVIYCTRQSVGVYGYDVASAQTGETWPINTAFPSTIQWNIHTGNLPIAYLGGSVQTGFSYNMNVARATGNTFANNWLMNQSSIGIQDQSLITGVGTDAFCGTKVAIKVPKGGNWVVGDTIVISGTAPSSMNANGSWTVDSYNGTPSPAIICLAGTTFGTGTWTAGTGVINGGVAWASNRYYNITGTLVSSTAAGGTSGAIASLSTFTPLTTASCPQAAGCPSIEGYAIAAGLGNTLAEVVACAKLNRRGAYNTACTAPTINDYIRSRTDASIPRPSL